MTPLHKTVTQGPETADRKMLTTLRTPRLDLVPATKELLQAARTGDQALAGALGASLPPSWPPEHYDRDTVQYSLDRMTGSEGETDWGMYLFLHRDSGNTVGRKLIGFGGFKGEPSVEGSVEIGYSVVRDYQRQGFATEAVGGFLQRAFHDDRVEQVIAETYPDRLPSQGVLRKCGFKLARLSSADDIIRFAISRDQWTRR